MQVIFSHGKESGPWGSKIKQLAEIAKKFDCSVQSIDYQTISDPDLRVEKLLKQLSNINDEILLVGSSMGGYVSLVVSAEVKTQGVFLLAPALYFPGYKVQDYPSNPKVAIVHGWSDDVIPVQNSIQYAQKANCSLHLIAGDHRLNSSIEAVKQLFERYLRACS